MNGILKDTFAEAVDRKMLFVYGAITLILVIIAFLLRNIELNVQTSDEIVSEQLFQTFTGIVATALSTFMSFLFFIAILSTAGLIPSMFVRGRAEYYLSKPVSRRRLLLSKFFGIWTVYSGLVLTSGLIILAVFYLAHGVFTVEMLWILAMEAVSFFIWLSILVLGGVLFGSYALSIVTVFSLWVVQGFINQFGEAIKELVNSSMVEFVIDAIYYILPKTGQVTEIGDRLAMNRAVESWMPVWTSLLFALVMIGLAVMRFNRRDY